MTPVPSRVRRYITAAAVVLGLLVVCGCAAPGAGKPATVSQVGGSSSKYQGTELNPPKDRPQFTLTDQSGQPYDFAAKTKGTPTVLYFGYTNCPDVCPLVMGTVGDALSKLPADLQKQVQVVFVTTDPTRDTPAALAAWLGHFDTQVANKFTGLTGTKQQVEAAQQAAGVPVAEDDGQLHSSLVLVYGKDDKAHLAWQADITSAAVQHDLPIVAG